MLGNGLFLRLFRGEITLPSAKGQIFKTGSPYIVQAGLELGSSCPRRMSTGFTDVPLTVSVPLFQAPREPEACGEGNTLCTTIPITWKHEIKSV